MKQITLRIPKNTLTAVESAADDRGVSRSEHVRDVLAVAVGHAENPDVFAGEHGEHADPEAVEAAEQRAREAEARVKELERTVDRLRNEKRTLIADREERKELVRFAEAERDR